MQDTASHVIIKDLPPMPERLPLFIVGDVHGCAAELNELLKLARTKVPQFQLFCVGDLFTKGPDPVGVMEILRENNALCIKGNHDWALAASIIAEKKRGIKTLPEHTQQTLYMIRAHKRAIFDFLQHLPHAYRTTVIPQVKHKTWEESYTLHIVHAGIEPEKGLEKTTERMLLTVRYLRPDEEGNLVLVPTGSRARPQDLEGRRRWHTMYNGPELIVFGHDAKQGLFRKVGENNRPICVGIDTGCTYGRALTGYFPEWDDAIQVPAKRTYFDLEKNMIITKSSSSRVAI